MEQIFLAMPRWYFFMALAASFGGGIFFSILYFVFYCGKTVTKG